LQEQIIGKTSIARKILASAGIAAGDLDVAQLKGRQNYLCLLRWAALRRSAHIPSDEARVLVRLLFWLGRTDTGDRAELQLRRDEDAAAGISARRRLRPCSAPMRDGPLPLPRTEEAEAAHVLVVNHALLLADAAEATSCPNTATWSSMRRTTWKIRRRASSASPRRRPTSPAGWTACSCAGDATARADSSRRS
jgi:Rad3-related DNA helicase